MALCWETRLLPSNASEVLCSRSARGGDTDSVSHAKYGSASLRHGKCCPPSLPVRFSFPVLVLHRGQEEEYWRTENRAIKGVYRIVKDKAKSTGILCARVNLSFTFLKKGKSPIFKICLLESAFAFVQTHSFLILWIWKLPLCIPLRLYPLIMCLFCVPLSNGISFCLKRL